MTILLSVAADGVLGAIVRHCSSRQLTCWQDRELPLVIPVATLIGGFPIATLFDPCMPLSTFPLQLGLQNNGGPFTVAAGHTVFPVPPAGGGPLFPVSPWPPA